MKSQPSYYSIVTANVLFCNELTADEKILFAHITTLQQKDGYCYASNRYFADVTNTTKETASRRISKLEKLGFIKTKILYKDDQKTIDKRIITLLTSASIPIDSMHNIPVDSMVNTPIDASVKDNNTRDNNTRMNNNFNSSKQNIGVKRKVKTSLILSKSAIETSLLQTFIEHREEIGKPFTQSGLNHFVDKLEKLQSKGENIKEIIEDSIISGNPNVYSNKKPWIKVRESKRTQGEEIQKILNTHGYANIFDVLESKV